MVRRQAGEEQFDCRLALTPLRGRFLGLGSRQNNKDKRTEIVRFHNVAEGDISRSQREHFTASASCHVSKIFALDLLTKITSFLKRFDGRLLCGKPVKSLRRDLCDRFRRIEILLFAVDFFAAI